MNKIILRRFRPLQDGSMKNICLHCNTIFEPLDIHQCEEGIYDAGFEEGAKQLVKFIKENDGQFAVEKFMAINNINYPPVK